jgi:hypothetical protein
MEVKSSSRTAFVAMACLGAVAFFVLGDFFAKVAKAKTVGTVVYLKNKVSAGDLFCPVDLEQVLIEQKDIPGKAVDKVSYAAGKTALYDSYPEILTSYLVGFPGRSRMLRIAVESYSDRGHLHEYARVHFNPPALVFNEWLLERLKYESSPKTEVKGDYFFFPYRNCVVMKVRSVKRDKNLRCLIKVDITEVLRGNLDRGVETLAIGKTETLEKSAELERLQGKTCIAAFNEYSRLSNNEPLDVDCFSIESVGGPPSSQDLQTRKRNLSKTLFPYQSCWLVTIQPPEPVLKTSPVFGESEPIDVTVRIDEMFLKEENDFADSICNRKSLHRQAQQREFRVGNVVKARLYGNLAGWYHSGLSSTKVGSRAIWSFNPSHHGNRYDFYNLHSPFPGQDFNEHDIARLRGWLRPTAAQIKSMRETLQDLLTQFWSAERLELRCRPENVTRPYMQALLTSSNLGPVLSGVLHADKPHLGKITWYAQICHGEPDMYEVDVVRGKQRWRIVSHCPDLLRTAEADFVKRLIEGK